MFVDVGPEQVLAATSSPEVGCIANSKTANSYDGALSTKPGVPGSGGRPTPGGAQSNSVGSRRGWMQVQPAFANCPGVTSCACVGEAVAPAMPSAAVRPTSAVQPRNRVTVLLMLPPFDSKAVELTVAA